MALQFGQLGTLGDLVAFLDQHLTKPVAHHRGHVDDAASRFDAAHTNDRLLRLVRSRLSRLPGGRRIARLGAAPQAVLRSRLLGVPTRRDAHKPQADRQNRSLHGLSRPCSIPAKWGDAAYFPLGKYSIVKRGMRKSSFHLAAARQSPNRCTARPRGCPRSCLWYSYPTGRRSSVGLEQRNHNPRVVGSTPTAATWCQPDANGASGVGEFGPACLACPVSPQPARSWPASDPKSARPLSSAKPGQSQECGVSQSGRQHLRRRYGQHMLDQRRCRASPFNEQGMAVQLPSPAKKSPRQDRNPTLTVSAGSSDEMRRTQRPRCRTAPSWTARESL